MMGRGAGDGEGASGRGGEDMIRSVPLAALR